MESMSCNEAGETEWGPITDYVKVVRFLSQESRKITLGFKAREWLNQSRLREIHQTSSSQSVVCGTLWVPKIF